MVEVCVSYLSLWPLGKYGGSELLISSTATWIAGLAIVPGKFVLASPFLSLFPLSNPIVKVSHLPEGYQKIYLWLVQNKG